MAIIRSVVLTALICVGSSSGMDTKAVLPVFPVEILTRILWNVIEKLEGTLTHKIRGALTLQTLDMNGRNTFKLSDILTHIRFTPQDITRFLQQNLVKIPMKLSIETGKIFVKHGADLNTSQDSDGNTLVHLAAIHGKTDELKTLIELGAYTNIPNNHDQIAIMCVTASQRQIREILSSAEQPPKTS